MQASDLLPFHPLANNFPLLNGAEFNGVVADVKANGLREPITLYQGMILDGRNRYRACLNTKVEPRFEQFKGDDAAALAFVISKNIHRRHLKAKEKREAIAKLLKADPNKSDRQIAKIIKASPTVVGKVRAEKEATGDVSTVDTRRDTKGRKQPAKKRTAVVTTVEARKAVGAVSSPKKQLASTKPAAELLYAAAGLRRHSTILAEKLREAEIKITGLESEVEELKAENAKLRAQLKVEGSPPASLAASSTTKKQHKDGPKYLELDATHLS